MPGVYDDGNPFIVGMIIASVLWQPQPDVVDPVFPDELASARFNPETATNKILIRNARKTGDITSRHQNSLFTIVVRRFNKTLI